MTQRPPKVDSQVSRDIPDAGGGIPTREILAWLLPWRCEDHATSTWPIQAACTAAGGRDAPRGRAPRDGTCRMADTPETGVCDRDARVFGTSNLFVCDGSLVPAAAYANTGLTIGALALRLAENINA